MIQILTALGDIGILALLLMAMAALAIVVATGLFTATVAAHKGYDRKAWFFAGAFFGLIGLLAAAGLPDLWARPRSAPTAGRV